MTDTSELVRYLGIEGNYPDLPSFPLFVPAPWLARIEKFNPLDPLLLQILPRHEETRDVHGYDVDPLGENRQSPRRGIIHKYKGRVLVIVTGACAVNCRYCFRRHFPYGEVQADSRAWEMLFEYVSARSDVTEVILSGGDPLALSDRRLSWIAGRISEIPHVDTLRVHTRLPVAIPQRVCDDLLEWVRSNRLHVVFVIHSNHHRELDQAVAVAMRQLAETGIVLLNQSVLLRDVNDTPEALSTLSRRLFDIGVLPYYLHLPDKVAGTAHFDVPEDRARQIFTELAARLPGYLVPRLVREIPGEACKVTLGF